MVRRRLLKGKMKVVGRLFGSAPRAWRGKRQAMAYGAAAPAGAVAARALSDEGDDPGLTDRVGPPVSEREATAESDKRSRRRLNRTSGAGDGPTGPDREGGGGPRLGWKIREEAGPKPFLRLKSNRVKENQF
jgi:hypothetical protein